MAFLRSVIRYNLATRKVLALNGYTLTGNTLNLSSQNELCGNQKLTNPKHHYSTDRNLSTATTAAPLSYTETKQKNAGQETPEIPQRDPLDVGFNDPLAAFKSKTTFELIRAYFVYFMCSSEYLVENNMKVSLKVFVLS
jgi:hypothetical protein